MSRTIKCNHCSKLLVNQQGLFYTVKKTKENCIVFTDVSTHKIISILFKNLSLGFILKIFLKFRKFQPRYSYKVYYKKECMCQAAHQASTNKNNLTEKKTNLPFSHVLFTMSDYKALDINIEARVKPPEVIWHQTIKALLALSYWNGCKTFLCIKEKNLS